MVRMNWVWAGAMSLALAAAGCGGASPEGPGTTTPPDDPGTVEQGLRADLRVRGAAVGDFSRLFVNVSEVRVLAGEKELAVEPGEELIDLANPAQAWKVGTVTIPTGTVTVQVELALERYGSYERALDNGEVRLPLERARFTVPVQLVRQNSKAVFELDLARSLADFGSERQLLVPQYTIRY